MRTNKKKKHNGTATKGGQSPYFRSRVSRGLDLLPQIDGRSGPARIFKDTYFTLVNHCGGEDGLSETLRLMCRRASALEAECVNLEARFALAHIEGKQPLAGEVDLYQRLVNSQRRVCEALGWHRTARDITPTLQQYMDAKELADA